MLFFVIFSPLQHILREREWSGESEGLGEGVDDLWTSNISGSDLKPGHPIYTVHFAPQPDTNCFINIKWWESNDMSALYCELFSVVASQQTEILLLLCYLFFFQHMI